MQTELTRAVATASECISLPPVLSTSISSRSDSAAELESNWPNRNVHKCPFALEDGAGSFERGGGSTAGITARLCARLDARVVTAGSRVVGEGVSRFTGQKSELRGGSAWTVSQRQWDVRPAPSDLDVPVLGNGR